ncbi:MAG: ABC transporter permease [Bacteroidetes bacterium]|nr:ABC transporter permease [Bacteroidota bacterium]MDA1121289.1 ABC transporter permease [Bacteroidota bacterium]
MRVLFYILQKEFLQIFRNKAMLPIIFVLPIVQMVILTFAADFELDHITYTYVDSDLSATSKRLLAKFEDSPYFQLSRTSDDFKDGMEALDQNEATLMLRIPQGFSHDLQKEKKAMIMLDVNSIDGQAATLSFSYATGIISMYNKEIIMEWNGLAREVSLPVETRVRYWFNEEMEYKNLMVPGILALLITMVGMFLSAMNIVREKEIGTIEQINVTPISKTHFLIGKMFPFWIIALFELGFGLTIGRLIFEIPLNGSIPLLFAYSAIYMLVVLGIGLWISSFTDTQQQAMFMAWFFIVIFILMSGLFTPIENMPQWAQALTYINPVAYYIKVVRAILLKGSNFYDLQFDFLVITIFAAVMMGLALLSYRKRG